MPAEAMLDERSLISSDHGVLRGPADAGTASLQNAILMLAKDGCPLGAAGIDVPVVYPDGRPALAYVIPLRHETLVATGIPRVVIAVFITPPPAETQPPMTAIAALYGLTPAETRVIEAISAGSSRAAVALQLGIAPSTMKTHLERIYAKTDTCDLPDLIRLLARSTAITFSRSWRMTCWGELSGPSPIWG